MHCIMVRLCVSVIFGRQNAVDLYEQFNICAGYPEHSEHFYIPDADSSVKLWANALNEVICST